MNETKGSGLLESRQAQPIGKHLGAAIFTFAIGLTEQSTDRDGRFACITRSRRILNLQNGLGHHRLYHSVQILQASLRLPATFVLGLHCVLCFDEGLTALRIFL